jgi:hypothetical protein
VRPLIGSRAFPADLGCDHQVSWIGMRCLCHQFFTDMRPVGVGGVEIDTGSRARRRTGNAALRTFGGPQMPGPVRPIAP